MKIKQNKFILNKYTYILIFMLVATLSIAYGYKSEFIAFKGIDKLEEMTQGKLGLRIIRRNVMKVFDELSIPNYNSTYYDVPIMDLSISKKAINAISLPINNVLNYQDTYYKSKYMLPVHDNKYTKNSKIKVTYNGENYKAKIKIHGRSEEHFLEKKKSFSIKFNKSKLLENIREIALIILDEQDITTVFSYYLVNKYLGISVHSKIVRLRINGVDQGLYLMEEKVRKELLEKNGLAGVDILQPIAMWTTQTNTTHTHQYTHNISSVIIKNLSNIDNGQLLKYKKVYNVDNYRELSKLINIDSFARFEAIRMIHADRHAAGGDNLKLFYNNSTGRFSPFYRSESVVGHLEKFAQDEMYIYDKLALSGNMNSNLFKIITKNNDFRNLRNKYLYDIISNKSEILNYYKSILDDFIDAIDEDVSNLSSQREYIYRAKSNYKLIEKNIEIIRKYLEYGRVYTLLTEINPREYELEIDADSNSYVRITNIRLFNKLYPNMIVSVKNLFSNQKNNIPISELNSYFSKEKYILALSNNLESADNQKKYRLVFDRDVQIEQLNIEYINTITGKEIKRIDNYIKKITKPKRFSFKYLKNNLGAFLKKNLGFSYDGNNIKFINRKYMINSDLIFPYGYNVFIPAGVTIELGHNISVLIYGGVKIGGSEQNPVTIKNSDKDKPFGAIIVLGDGNSKVRINNLDLSGGSDAKVNGVFGSGSISLYNHKSVKVINSNIHQNYSDDGMNIKNSKFVIVNSRFINNFADQVDIDYSEGSVRSTLFKYDKEKSHKSSKYKSNNGDGLDLSGSKVVIIDNIYEGFLDKALSIGENTKVFASHNTFRNNRSAITAKDQSDVYVYNNQYKDNKYNIEAYQKKNIFKQPNVFIINEIHSVDEIKNKSSKIFSPSSRIDSIKADGMSIFPWLSSLNWIKYTSVK
jgi:hypothetical protein